MPVLPIVYAPDPIFRKKCAPVDIVDDEIRKIADDMIETMHHEMAIGLGANMLGISKPVAVIDLREEGVSKSYILINPEIFWHSDGVQSFEEASLSFPGISANITRPKSIKVRYLNYEGVQQEMSAEGFLASVIQHEVDYLNGKIFLDYLSKMKRDILIKKMQKYMKQGPVHIHTEHCNH